MRQITPELTVPVFFMCVIQVTANVLHFASLLAFTDVCSGFMCSSLFGLYGENVHCPGKIHVFGDLFSVPHVSPALV